MMIEWWAYILDVVAFYSSEIANELYLRTAQRNTSLRRLSELIGYTPKPPLAASATLALFAEPGQPVGFLRARPSGRMPSTAKLRRFSRQIRTPRSTPVSTNGHWPRSVLTVTAAGRFCWTRARRRSAKDRSSCSNGAAQSRQALRL